MTPTMKKGLLATWRDAVADSDLDSTAKVVAGLAIATHMDRNGYAYPGRQRIARRSSLSIRTVDKAIRRVEAAGFLEVTRVSGGNSKTNGYQACLPETANELRRREWDTATLTTQTANLAALNGELGSPESSESKRKQAGPLIEETCNSCGKYGPCVDDGSDVLCKVCSAVVKQDPSAGSASAGWGAHSAEVGP
jgi:hypothetical protein